MTRLWIETGLILIGGGISFIGCIVYLFLNWNDEEFSLAWWCASLVSVPILGSVLIPLCVVGLIMSSPMIGLYYLLKYLRKRTIKQTVT